MEKLLHYRFMTRNDYSAPIINQQLILHCTPRMDEGQTLLQSTLTVEPDISLRPLQDGLGNEMYAISVNAPHTVLSYTAVGVARVVTGQAAPPPMPLYARPGALTVPGAGLRRWFHDLSLQDLAPAQMAALLCDAVHARISYWPGVTDMTTTAEQALSCGVGVCQDLTHVYTVLARLAGLSVRYCIGITVGEGTTHAWPEVFYDGAWHGWDPTRKMACDAEYLRLAVGRDAADCPVERGVFCGACTQLQTVHMQVESLSPAALAKYL